MSSLKGKVVLVTGGMGGIGRATASCFTSLGATVVLTDKAQQSVPGEEYCFIPANAASEQEIAEAVSQVVKLFGRIDVLINNCGVGANLDHAEGRAIVCQTAENFNSEDFDRVMTVNLKSAIWFVKHTVPHIPRNDESAIISASSIWSRGKLHYALPYATSKAALSIATLNWAYQFAPIRSVAIIIGGIDTPMLRTNPNGTREVAEQTLLKRAGKPEEIAETYAFVASCRYITATEIVVDGGSFNR